MKLRYMMLPLIIISIMIFIIDRDKEMPVNKELNIDNITISYPYFSSNLIDTYIEDYLEEYKNNIGIIDYDYYKENNKYYLVFYKYIFNNNMLSSSIDTFNINIEENKIDRIDKEVFNYNLKVDKSINKDKLIALTFDDGPNYNTSKILDVLDKYNAKATFFILGSKIKGNENIIKKMSNMDMEIGNHTYSHLLLTKYKEDKIKSEIDDTSNLIFEVIGKHPTLLRPSYGSVNSKIKSIANTPIIIWDIDTLDWKYHNSKKIAKRVINKVKDGDIILMHDIYSATLNSLNIIIPKLQNEGYNFVTVSELFYLKGIPLEKGKVYGYAR